MRTPSRKLRKMPKKHKRNSQKIRTKLHQKLKITRKKSMMPLMMYLMPMMKRPLKTSKKQSKKLKKISKMHSKMLPPIKLNSKKIAESTKMTHQISMTQVMTTAMAPLNGSSFHLMMRLRKTPERSGSSQKMTKMKDTSSSAVLTSQLVSASMSTTNSYTS